MKRIIFFSVLIFILSCKKAEDKPVKDEVLQKTPKEIEVKTYEKDVELPEYSLIKKEDISIKTSMDANASINKRLIFKYLVSNEITREQIEPLLTKLIEKIISEDYDIDDLTIWLYSDKDLISGSYNVAMATYSPKKGEVTKEIALSNNKESYIANFIIADNFQDQLISKSENSTNSGLNDKLRKKIYQELSKVDEKARAKADKIYPYDENFNSSKYANKLDEITKKYEKEISRKYKIDSKIIEDISEEGFNKGW